MKSFWSYIKNGTYAVGCTGQTVYVYDNEENEVAKFKDIIYAYTPMFSPNNDLFVVKSTDGRMAVYSLETLSLIKKLRFSSYDCSQDDSFCFSRDGKFLYNIERHISNCRTRLGVYETESFSAVKYLFDDRLDLVLSEIEYDEKKDALFVTGFTRDHTGVIDKCFVARLKDDALDQYTEIPRKEYDYITGYKSLELNGFTDKAKRWSGLHYKNYDLSNIQNERVFFSDYIDQNN